LLSEDKLYFKQRRRHEPRTAAQVAERTPVGSEATRQWEQQEFLTPQALKGEAVEERMIATA